MEGHRMGKGTNDNGALGVTGTGVWPGHGTRMGERLDRWVGATTQEAPGKGDCPFILKAMRSLLHVLKTKNYTI